MLPRNPFLYQTGQVGMNDIITGSNPGCGTIGFYATSGWDPVTGVGTPNFDLLRQIVLGTIPSKASSTMSSPTPVRSPSMSSSVGGRFGASRIQVSFVWGVYFLGTLLLHLLLPL